MAQQETEPSLVSLWWFPGCGAGGVWGKLRGPVCVLGQVTVAHAGRSEEALPSGKAIAPPQRPLVPGGGNLPESGC